MRVYQFIEAEKEADESFSIKLACELLGVSRSGFYDWKTRQDRPPTDYELEQAKLLEDIKTIHEDSGGNYGSPRIYAELRDNGWTVGENRVARTMRVNGITGRCGRRRGHHTTKQADVQPDIPDLVQRDFTAPAPDRLWCTDISYVPTRAGWLYVAVILDACSRMIVGWQAAAHMRTSLVLDALRMALGARSPAAGLVVHSDRGSQFTSQAWLQALEAAGALPSMGRVGWCWDNAMAESWFAGFKNELVVPKGPFDNRQIATKEVYRYIRWHNLQRRHSALDMLAPADWERAHTFTRAA